MERRRGRTASASRVPGVLPGESRLRSRARGSSGRVRRGRRCGRWARGSASGAGAGRSGGGGPARDGAGAGLSHCGRAAQGCPLRPRCRPRRWAQRANGWRGRERRVEVKAGPHAPTLLTSTKRLLGSAERAVRARTARRRVGERRGLSGVLLVRAVMAATRRTSVRGAARVPPSGGRRRGADEDAPRDRRRPPLRFGGWVLVLHCVEDRGPTLAEPRRRAQVRRSADRLGGPPAPPTRLGALSGNTGATPVRRSSVETATASTSDDGCGTRSREAGAEVTLVRRTAAVGLRCPGG